jgi:excisionase family DNA binding protein
MLNPQSGEGIANISTPETSSREAFAAISADSENAYSDSGNSPPQQEPGRLKSSGLDCSRKHFSSNGPKIVSLRKVRTGPPYSGTKAPLRIDGLSQAGPLPERLELLKHALTATDLAQLLQVSPVTIYKLAKANKLPSFRIGTAVRFDPHAVARWLTQT